MRKLGLLMVQGINLFVKYLPTALVGVAVVFMFNTIHKDQQRLKHSQQKLMRWQAQHGAHSTLVKEAFNITEKRLTATDKALSQLQDTLHKTTLVISALRAEAHTVDRVRDNELNKLYRRAELLKQKFGLHKTAAAMENKLLRQQLARLKRKLVYYEKLQKVK